MGGRGVGVRERVRRLEGEQAVRGWRRRREEESSRGRTGRGVEKEERRKRKRRRGRRGMERARRRGREERRENNRKGKRMSLCSTPSQPIGTSTHSLAHSLLPILSRPKGKKKLVRSMVALQLVASPPSRLTRTNRAFE